MKYLKYDRVKAEFDLNIWYLFGAYRKKIYIDCFRMSKKSFDELSSVIHPYITHQNTNMSIARRKTSFSVSK